ncbi:Chromosome partition protein Smc [Streptococcus infantarius subsp. infantarius]|nr:Chromosome partition protein Smc [Streptococcus infantarius subsp. infantarius]MCO4676330.1 Chromosome partition protein Smc [Streptococcus infantarius subsp. infantarius]MCO4692288.1 Chromosome partition protein Smc [Streptococcus infantarius subsp. infantarius]MCO4700935.1 Chromosome partition protein Smc [Streptococcus infantarius subsp. infantarius]
MVNIGKLVATATLDIAPFQTNTKQLKTYMRGIDSSLKAVEKSISGQGSKIEGLRAVYNETGQALKGYQSLLVQQSQKYNALKAEIGDFSTATAAQKDALIGAHTAMMDTAAKVSELQGRLQSLATEMNVFSRMGSAMTNFGNTLQSVGGKMTGLGNTMTVGVTAPIVAGVGAVVKSAISWESAFAGVKKTNDEVVDSNGNVVYSYADLESGLRGLTAQLPASHEEIAGVAEAAGQLGIKSQDVVSFTKTMIDMGESTNLSAEDAASAIAKIANITGLTSDEYQRFGSSVVALGNNFATTESDIVSMANRLAASGTLAGLTNQEILGLATAMSSVGIEAEAGGTAMTQTLAAIESAVAAGGEDLQKFATVAGESSEEFASKWKNKPVEAIQDFIRGLGKLDEKGESATMVLDDMGLSGVRQSNMLKSLALAADTMTGAVDLSNRAWDENTALTNEASTRYETTESKLKMLKNQVVDMAIDFGGPFVDALKNGLEASKPLIQTLSDMAKKFNELSPAQQQHIMKWLAISAAAGPALSILGKLTTGLGSMFKVFGSVNSGIGKLVGKLAPMASDLTGVESAAVGATGAASNFGGAVGLLSNPLGLVVGGAAALAGGLVVLANAKQHAREEAQKYGTTLSGETKGALDQFGTAVTNTKIAMTNFETGAVQSADNVKTAVADMMKQITQGAEDSKARIDELAQKFGFTPEQVAAAKAKQDQIVSNAQAMTDQITAIYERHNGDVSKLTTAEKTIVENNIKELCAARVKELNLGKSKEKAVLSTFNGEIGKMTMAQLKDSSKALQTAMKEEQKAYKDQRSGLKESLEQGIIDQQEYNTRMAALKEQHKATMSEFGQALVKIAQEQDAQSGQFGVYAEKIRRVLADYDMSFEELSQHALDSANKIGQHTAMIGTYTSDMSADARNATDQWNALTLDPLTGELKTNAVQEVTKALTAENGWNNMEFILKNANVNSNARVEVADALQKLGEWDKTTPEQKELLFQNDKGLLAIYQSKDQLDIWNGMPTNVKELLCEDKNFTSNAERAKEMLNKWNSATPDQKDLIAHNKTAGDVSAAISMIYSIPDSKNTDLTATDNTGSSTASAQGKINNVNQKSIPGILASDLTGGATGSAQGKINNVNQKSVPGILASDLTGGPTSSAKNNLNSVRDKSVKVTAVDNASGVIRGIASWLGSLKDKVVNVVTHHTKNEKGTNFHPGGLALVNDQKGGTYRELVTLPNGVSFIPKDRNVMLPLPRGSKVLPAGKTKQLFPRYANGIGFENTRVADVAQKIGNLQGNSDVAVIQNGDSDTHRMIGKIIDLIIENTHSIERLADRQVIIENYMDAERVGRSVAKTVTSEQERQNSIKNAIYGKGW